MADGTKKASQKSNSNKETDTTINDKLVGSLVLAGSSALCNNRPLFVELGYVRTTNRELKLAKVEIGHDLFVSRTPNKSIHHESAVGISRRLRRLSRSGNTQFLRDDGHGAFIAINTRGKKILSATNTPTTAEAFKFATHIGHSIPLLLSALNHFVPEKYNTVVLILKLFTQTFI